MRQHASWTSNNYGGGEAHTGNAQDRAVSSLFDDEILGWAMTKSSGTSDVHCSLKLGGDASLAWLRAPCPKAKGWTGAAGKGRAHGGGGVRGVFVLTRRPTLEPTDYGWATPRVLPVRSSFLFFGGLNALE